MTGFYSKGPKACNRKDVANDYRTVLFTYTKYKTRLPSHKRFQTGHIHLSSFRYGLTKNDFAARKVSETFEKHAPDRIGIWNVGFNMEGGKLGNPAKNPRS